MSKTLGFLMGAPAAPGVTLGAGVRLVASANGVTTTWAAAYTPQTGDALVRALFLDNGTGVDPVSFAIGGTAVTVRQKADAGHGGTSRGMGVWIGTVRGLGAPSARDVTMTTSGTTGAGKIIVRVTDLAGWTGSVGHGNAAVATGSTLLKQFGVSAALLGSAGLLVGVGGVADANCTPLSAAGWTKTDEAVVGTAAGVSCDAGFFTTTGSDAGSTKDFTATSDVAWTDWAAGFLELL